MLPLRRCLPLWFLLTLALALAAEPTPAEIVASLVRQNDARLPAWLTAGSPESTRLAQPREASRALKLSVAAYTHPESRYHHDPAALAFIARLATALRRLQHDDGSLDAEFAMGNPQSPPDTAFALRHLAQAQTLLLRDTASHPATAPVRELLRDLLGRGALLLRTGGVHTPNHRWVICGALAHLQSLDPAPANLARIDDWLGEGIDQDADGQFSERSTIYSYVTDEGLLDLALHLDRPTLLEPIRRNLELLLDLADADGELETVASRRQDQQGREPRRLHQYYIPLRHLAIALNHGRFAAAVRDIERRDLAHVTDQLSEWMEFPSLARPLPPSAPAPENLTRIVPGSGLARLRRGAVTATIFGGSDWPAVRDISSGLSTNPTFFRFRKGAAVLESVRLSPAFFNLGFFRSVGLAVAPDRRTFTLHQTQRAAYYQPLPAAFRRADGDYPLTNDGRFYSKLDFPHRPRDEKQLTTRISVRELPPPAAPGAFELSFAIDDTPGIGVTLELCFRPGGTLTGAEPRTSPAEPDTFFLKSGTARYTVGPDTIEFGPGSFGSARVSLTGEDYSWRGGQLRAEGLRVYLTGVTPFRHTLVIR